MAQSQIPTLALTAAFLEYGWTQHALARCPGGAKVSSMDPAADCWDLIGALNAAMNCRPIGDSVLLDVFSEGVGGNLARWNDAPERTLADLLSLLSLAATRG